MATTGSLERPTRQPLPTNGQRVNSVSRLDHSTDTKPNGWHPARKPTAAQKRPVGSGAVDALVEKSRYGNRQCHQTVGLMGTPETGIV